VVEVVQITSDSDSDSDSDSTIGTQPDVCDTLLNIIHAAEGAAHTYRTVDALSLSPRFERNGAAIAPNADGSTAAVTTSRDSNRPNSPPAPLSNTNNAGSGSSTVNAIAGEDMVPRRLLQASEERVAVLERHLEEADATRRELQQLIMGLSGSIEQQVDRKVRTLLARVKAGELSIDDVLQQS
jgi:hypothetical protein